jgi:serine/threonine protein kinase
VLKPPFFGDNLITLGYNICNGIPEDLPPQYSHRLKALVAKFLKKDPNGRPTMA